ncbi:MAG TPA: hypothetical protein DDY57_06365 [Franconibacter pulveris]|nr:hypothetical protein [Franconibacter pulveris]
MPLGAVLAVMRPTLDNIVPIKCTNVTSVTMNAYYYGTSAKKSTYGDDVYETPVKGIGVRGVTEGLTNDVFVYGTKKSYSFATPQTFTVANKDTYFEFLKIGDITLTPSAVTGSQMRTDIDTAVLVAGYITIGSVVASTCYVKQPNVQIPLGTWTNLDFTGPGSTTTTIPFNFTINCNKGTKVNAIIKGKIDNNYTGTIALESALNFAGSVASGVGVQIVDSTGHPIPIDRSMVLFSSTVVGDSTVSWGARYIQTSATITGGTANAMASVELTYE